MATWWDASHFYNHRLARHLSGRDLQRLWNAVGQDQRAEIADLISDELFSYAEEHDVPAAIVRAAERAQGFEAKLKDTPDDIRGTWTEFQIRPAGR